jgi:hypothetical protein
VLTRRNLGSGDKFNVRSMRTPQRSHHCEYFFHALLFTHYIKGDSTVRVIIQSDFYREFRNIMFIAPCVCVFSVCFCALDTGNIFHRRCAKCMVTCGRLGRKCRPNGISTTATPSAWIESTTRCPHWRLDKVKRLSFALCFAAKHEQGKVEKPRVDSFELSAHISLCHILHFQAYYHGVKTSV